MSDTTVGRIEFAGVVTKEDRDAMASALFAPARALLATIHPERGLAATVVEPPPQPNSNQPVWDAVIADMRARDGFGRAKYGTPLQAGNGRDALVDAYQEALDLVVYLKQAILERG